MNFPNPLWIKNVPASDRQGALHSFTHSLALLYATEAGKAAIGPAARSYNKAFAAIAAQGPQVSPLPMPKWFSALPAAEREAARTRFLIRVAALYATRAGTMSALSVALRLHSHTMATFASGRTALSPALCAKIERLCGRHALPLHMLNPAVFGDA